MSDTRPLNCRFRLKDEGKPYPRSGCEACNRHIGLGNECKDAAPPSALENALNTLMKGEHTVERQWGNIVYWKDGTACGCFDQWTNVDVHVWPNAHGVADMKFTRAQQEFLERVDRALLKAFGHGKKARSKEFKALIEDIGYGV